MSQESEETAAKRGLEGDAEEQPAKRVRTEEAAAAAADDNVDADNADADAMEEAGAADEEQQGSSEEAAEDADVAEQPTAAAAPAEPVRLGYRVFKDGQEASNYVHEILKRTKPGHDLNEYELLLLLDLLQKGHPRASDKMAKGVKSIRVEEMRVGNSSSSCFHIQALDGSLEDFSYRKCLLALFPDSYVMKESSQLPRRGRGGGGGGRGGGGRGGGSRGGRGGRGGRGFRGRGGRGGRGRGRGRD